MLRFLTISFVASLVSYGSQCQDIKDGFIILSNGTYKYGLIQFNPSLNSYEECQFASGSGKPYETFTPDQILGYGVINGVHFTTKSIRSGTSDKKQFLRKEVDGLVQLYSFRDDRLFVEKDSFEELTKENYKGVLSEVLNSCKKTVGYLKKTSFDPQDIRDLFIKYQVCVDPASGNGPTDRFHFDMLVGAESNSATIQGKQMSFESEIIPLTDKTLFSLGGNAIISFKNTKFSFTTGIFYYQQNFYARWQTITPEYSSTNKVNFDYNEFVIPIGLQYSLFRVERQLMPYIKASLAVPITFNSSLIGESEKEYTDMVYFERYNLPQDFNQFLQPTISIGTTLDLFHKVRNVFELSYVKGGGELKTSSSSISATSNRIIILIGFRF